MNDETPTLTTELIADPPTERDEQVEKQVERKIEKQVEQQVETQVETQVEMKVKPVFKRPEEPKKKAYMV